MAAPNIKDTVSLYAKTVFVAVGTSITSVLSNAASSNKLLKIVSLYAANVDGTASVNMTLKVFNQAALAGTGYQLAEQMLIQAKGTIVAVSKDAPIYLEENMSVGALASATGDLVVVCSYEEYDDA